jgi:glucose 1-dehydrogenase
MTKGEGRVDAHRFIGRTVLVTGGNSGIGQAIALRFAREGAAVAINYREDERAAEETRRQAREQHEFCVSEVRACGVGVALVQADVSREADVRRMFEEVVAELGPIDVLTNNAGIQLSEESHRLEAEEFDRVVGVNLRGAFLCAREAIRLWLDSDRAGVILNTSSVHERIPKPRFVAYSVSKGGLGNLTRTLALEYADRRIRVNGIAPGATITPMNRAWVEDAEKRQEVMRHIPLGRPAEPEEIAAAAAFLCSDEAAYITGQTLYVDGGLTLYPDFRSSWSSE